MVDYGANFGVYLPTGQVENDCTKHRIGKRRVFFVFGLVVKILETSVSRELFTIEIRKVFSD